MRRGRDGPLVPRSLAAPASFFSVFEPFCDLLLKSGDALTLLVKTAPKDKLSVFEAGDGPLYIAHLGDEIAIDVLLVTAHAGRRASNDLSHETGDRSVPSGLAHWGPGVDQRLEILARV